MSELLFTILVFLAFITFLLLLYNNVSVVKRYKVKTKKPCGGLKIVLISDFHNNKRLLGSIVKKVRACAPDIIIIAGDLVDRRRPDLKLPRLLAARGISDVYYVTGNHEAVLGRERVIEQLGCSDIVLDERYKIYERFSVLGISDRIVDSMQQRQDLFGAFRAS